MLPTISVALRDLRMLVLLLLPTGARLKVDIAVRVGEINGMRVRVIGLR